MPESKISICNQALARIAVTKSIQDVETETSTEAAQCRRFYDNAVNTLLEAMPWSFAEVEQNLALLDSETRTGYAYVYEYPNDCARANHIVIEGQRPGQLNTRPIPFRVVQLQGSTGLGIATDQENAKLAYNKKLESPAQFSATFVRALTLLLAIDIAVPLKVNARILAEVNRLWSIWYNAAATNSLEENQEDEMPLSEFQTVRN